MTESVLNSVLDDSLELACAIVTVQTLAEQGHEAEALVLLNRMKPAAEDLIPRLRGIIKGIGIAQAEAEQVRDLPQPRIVCVASFGQPQPHPHTANTQSTTPTRPDPIIA